MARSTSLRVSRRWLRSATSRSSSFSSVNRETAISIAGTTSLLLNGLTRYAMAPASRARSTRSRCEKAVSISTGAMDSSAIFSAAEMPSSLGIFTSRITRSGRCSRASSTARSPSPASPTTVYPSSSSISLRSSRISASSSAMTTRVVIGGTCDVSSGTSAGWGDSGALNVGSLAARQAGTADKSVPSCGKVGARRVTVDLRFAGRPGSPAVEAMVSNTIQRRFESDPGYFSSESKVTICQRMSTFPVNIRFFAYRPAGRATADCRPRRCGGRGPCWWSRRPRAGSRR